MSETAPLVFEFGCQDEVVPEADGADGGGAASPAAVEAFPRSADRGEEGRGQRLGRGGGAQKDVQSNGKTAEICCSHTFKIK